MRIPRAHHGVALASLDLHCLSPDSERLAQLDKKEKGEQEAKLHEEQ